MCGIAGYSGKKVPDLLEQMNNKMYHRGPDDDGFFNNEHIHLCMRRLSIVDLEGGNQPMFNAAGNIVVVFNGEIYNHVQLRQELEKDGVVFATANSDTEVIVHLYEKYGIDFLHKVNGMYGIAIYDGGLWLIRDRIGEKPIYYTYSQEQQRFSFSSEFNVIKRSQLKENLNFQSLYWYFGQKAMPANQTIDKRISKLPPGCYLHIDKDYAVPKVVPYYKLAQKPAKIGTSNDTIQKDIENLIIDSVKLRMSADVEVGSFLSGGIDSSLVVALACKCTSHPLKTYSLVYNEEIYNKSSDRKYARLVSEKFATDHTEVLLTPEILLQELPKIVHQFGQPNSAVISNWFISKEMSKAVKVALSGDGSDELFGSYFLHRVAGALTEYQKKRDEAIITQMPDYEAEFVRSNVGKPFAELVNKFAIFSQQEQKQLFQPEFYQESQFLKAVEERNANLYSDNPLNKMLEYDCKNLLVDQILNYTDVLGMAHALEIRVPFLDPRLVDYIFSLDHSLKIKNGETKYILKKIAEKYLPKDLIYRPKEGFVEPSVYWLSGPLKEFCLSYLKSDSFNSLQILNKQYVQEILDKFYASNDFYLGKKVWNLLMYAVWEKNCAN